MTQPITTVGQDATVREAAELMVRQRIGSVLVVDDEGNLKGIVTESDYAEHLSSSAIGLQKEPLRRSIRRRAN